MPCEVGIALATSCRVYEAYDSAGGGFLIGLCTLHGGQPRTPNFSLVLLVPLKTLSRSPAAFSRSTRPSFLNKPGPAPVDTACVRRSLAGVDLRTYRVLHMMVREGLACILGPFLSILKLR